MAGKEFRGDNGRNMEILATNTNIDNMGNMAGQGQYGEAIQVHTHNYVCEIKTEKGL